MKFFKFIPSIFSLLFFASIALAEEYNALIVLSLQGKDGYHAVQRNIKIPFIPTKDIPIDLFTFDKIGWATNSKSFLLYCKVVDKDLITQELYDAICFHKDKDGKSQWITVFRVVKEPKALKEENK